MKLIWHDYLIFSLSICAHENSTEIGLRGGECGQFSRLGGVGVLPAGVKKNLGQSSMFVTSVDKVCLLLNGNGDTTMLLNGSSSSG